MEKGSELLIHLVTENTPKMLIGVDQKVGGQDTVFARRRTQPLRNRGKGSS